MDADREHVKSMEMLGISTETSQVALRLTGNAFENAVGLVLYLADSSSCTA